MRKALAKTYIYELIFLCIYLIVMNKLLEIFEEKFYFRSFYNFNNKCSGVFLFDNLFDNFIEIAILCV